MLCVLRGFHKFSIPFFGIAGLITNCQNSILFHHSVMYGQFNFVYKKLST